MKKNIEKFYFNGAEITRVKKDKFYIIGHKNKGEIVNFISKKFNIENFRCIWMEVEEVKEVNGWKYEALKIS